MLLQCFVLVDEGRDDHNTTKSGHIRPAIEMAFHWWADDGPTLNAGLVFRGSGPVLLRYPTFL